MLLKGIIEFIDLWKEGALKLFLIALSIVSPIGFLVPLSVLIIPLVILNIDISIFDDNLDKICSGFIVVFGPYMLARYWDKIV